MPDFFTRRRFVDLAEAPVRFAGRAWSGHGVITSVEVSADAGATWMPAEVEPPTGVHAYTQPLEPVWNLGGYAVNAVHRVEVTVRA